MTETIPAVYAIAQEMLTQAKSLYRPDGEYRWQCGYGVWRLAFEAAVTIAVKPIQPEDVPASRTDDFTFCGFPASVSRYLPEGRLELYFVDEEAYRTVRVSLIEFPVTRHF